MYSRCLSGSVQVTTPCLTCLNVSQISSIVYEFILGFLFLFPCLVSSRRSWSKCCQYLPKLRSRSSRDASVSSSVFYVCLISDVSLEKFAKKLLGESEIEDVLRRLDRLTLDEARMTGTETLQVVHGLVSNMKLVMDGTHSFAPS